MQWRIMSTGATSNVYSSDQEHKPHQCQQWHKSHQCQHSCHVQGDGISLQSTHCGFIHFNSWKAVIKSGRKWHRAFQERMSRIKMEKKKRMKKKSDLFSLKQLLTLSPLAVCDNISCLWQEQAPFQNDIPHKTKKDTYLLQFQYWSLLNCVCSKSLAQLHLITDQRPACQPMHLVLDSMTLEDGWER